MSIINVPIPNSIGLAIVVGLGVCIVVYVVSRISGYE